MRTRPLRQQRGQHPIRIESARLPQRFSLHTYERLFSRKPRKQ